MPSGTLPPCEASSVASSLAGPLSTSLISSSAWLPMMFLARFTSATPGNCTMIWSLVVPYGATTGSETPSSLTRRSIVWMAWVTDSARR